MTNHPDHVQVLRMITGSDGWAGWGVQPWMSQDWTISTGDGDRGTSPWNAAKDVDRFPIRLTLCIAR